jgi:hypothetical protein
MTAPGILLRAALAIAPALMLSPARAQAPPAPSPMVVPPPQLPVLPKPIVPQLPTTASRAPSGTAANASPAAEPTPGFGLLMSSMPPLLATGQRPPVPPAGPATTPAPRGSCGCPHLTPVATPEKPDSGRAELELSADDLAWTFSNRRERFAGSWAAARADLDRALDPDGRLGIAVEPAPAAARGAPALIEGDLVRFLIAGPPDPRDMPAAPHAPPGEDPQVATQKFLYGPARFEGLVVDLVTTVARADKYGEPGYGLRAAALDWLRFLIEDLGRMPPARSAGDARAARIAMLRGQSLYALQSLIEQAIRPDPRWARQAMMGRLNGWARRLDGRPPAEGPSQGLPLDAYDLASAALDAVLALDAKGELVGLTEWLGRPTRFDAHGVPLSDPAGPDGVRQAMFLTRALVELAALHGRFGGPAPPGSPAEAVACKAFSVLIGLADRRLAHAAAFRRYLWAYLLGERAFGPQPDPEAFAAPRYRALRAAGLLAGFDDPSEAALAGSAMLARAESTYMLVRNGPLAAEFRRQVEGELATIRDATGYATGAGRLALIRLVDDHLDRIRRFAAAVDAARDPTWSQAGALLPIVMGFPDAAQVPPILVNRTALQQISHDYLELWAAAAPDISRSEWQDLCGPLAAPPRMFILARTVSAPLIVGKLYRDVPLAISLVFDEPYDRDSYPVEIDVGETLRLEATPANDDRTWFRTGWFQIDSPEQGR